MTADDLANIVKGLAPVLREQITTATVKAMAGLESRLVALEQRPVVNGTDGAPGPPGPPGPAGRDGERGADGQPGPMGERGADGQPGPPGHDAAPIPQSALAEAVAGYLAANPPASGRDGRDGVDGAVGKDGQKGDPGEPGRDGRDGQPGVPGLQGEKGLDGKDGRDGINGKDGSDGLGIDDYDEAIDDDGRTLVRRFVRDGHVVKEFRFKTATQIYRGIWEETKAYDVGDTVTLGGSLWYAKEASTGVRPNEHVGKGAGVWQMCVKHGRDGREGKAGPAGPVGPRGEKGDPGRGHY